MERDPATDANTDGSDFIRPDPYAGEAVSPSGGDIPGGKRGDDNIFEPAQIAMNVFAVSLQVHNGITDQLARPMKRHLPATTDAMDRHLTGVEQISLVASPAQGEYGRVFEQDERVRNLARNPLLYQGLLPCLRGSVIHQAWGDTREFH